MKTDNRAKVLSMINENAITISQDGDSVLSFLFSVKNTHFYIK